MKIIISRSIRTLAIILLCFPLSGGCQQSVINISLDAVNSATSPFKLTTGGNISHYGNRINKWGAGTFNAVKDVGINEIRTHDIKSMDWDLIFKDWNADPLNAQNYDFTAADSVMQGLVTQNFVPFLRLGVSFAASKSRRLPGTNPPDAKKWAIIAERIVAHYVDGWASGFKYPVKYVEIWNEPDLNFYTGTPDKFRDLFRESLIYIKKCHPNLKVGGCGIANFALHNNYGDLLIAYLADPNSDGNFSDRTPLDFYSWHVYEQKKGSDVFVKFAGLVKNSLTKYGYINTESLCTEWNSALPSPYLKTVDAGVDVGATLIAAENFGVTRIYFYPLIETWGMFNIANMGTAQFAKNKVNLKWNSMAWAHKAYSDLRSQAPLRLPLVINNNNVMAIAGKTANNKTIRMMLCSKQQKKQLQVNIKALPATNYDVTWKVLTSDGINTTKTQSVKSTADGSISLSYNRSSVGLMLIELQAN
ncbi:hypothetical protein EOD41_12485 [Mucilaginibacter limnophilus]|uniref:Glycosyl hydrolases family 39 N-terminal catalytic domain-containing protein n=1 Tax=Mucilaginibacter limnophilus TaxID=1932778 RepID=A0A3S2V0Z3_9SPHI|nr:hypothetical protein [Mucilaginibacter limnophilus]RVU00295.1 hypothetical protein EOD41_12485 [Mucilaginibacter limnophilus]